jgi:hypothetical protein
MQIAGQNGTKRLYVTPHLAVHGTLEDVTQQVGPRKTFGTSDGLVLAIQGVDIPIKNLS